MEDAAPGAEPAPAMTGNDAAAAAAGDGDMEVDQALSRRQLSVGVLDQLAATVLVRQLDEVLEQRRTLLRERRAVLLAELATQLPSWSANRLVDQAPVYQHR